MTGRLGSAVLGSLLATAGGAFALWLGIYGFTLFLLIPALLGGLVTWAVRPATALRAAGFGAFTVFVAVLSLLLLGREGAVCLIVALPLALPLGAIGGLLVHSFQSAKLRAGSTAMLLLLPTASLTWDVNAKPQVFQVRTALDIAASPEAVWKNVVSFPDLSEPEEWYFHTGIAYPTGTRIVGTGEGAVRYCEFSTGSLEEPVTVWDEPNLLRFNVTRTPAPMKEWGLYGQVDPKHLDGYFISRQGQFRLIRLSNGHTLLEGTSWYQHGLWPAEYWRWWSDAIIHRIHLRVLNHIKQLSE